jgi:hypothetical protein
MQPSKVGTGVGAPMSRVEDARFLRGLGRYVDDMPAAPGHTHGAVAFSARAQMRNVDTVAARALPGVLLVLTAADISELGVIRCVTPRHRRDGPPIAQTPWRMLAMDTVAHRVSMLRGALAFGLHENGVPHHGQVGTLSCPPATRSHFSADAVTASASAVSFSFSSYPSPAMSVQPPNRASTLPGIRTADASCITGAEDLDGQQQLLGRKPALPGFDGRQCLSVLEAWPRAQITLGELPLLPQCPDAVPNKLVDI